MQNKRVEAASPCNSTNQKSILPSELLPKALVKPKKCDSSKINQIIFLLLKDELARVCVNYYGLYVRSTHIRYYIFDEITSLYSCHDVCVFVELLNP